MAYFLEEQFSFRNFSPIIFGFSILIFVPPFLYCRLSPCQKPWPVSALSHLISLNWVLYLCATIILFNREGNLETKFQDNEKNYQKRRFVNKEYTLYFSTVHVGTLILLKTNSCTFCKIHSHSHLKLQTVKNVCETHN